MAWIVVVAACLRVGGGIVWIQVVIDGAQVRLFGGIDQLIGVAAGECERRDREHDGKPRGRFPSYWGPTLGRPSGRRAGELSHKVFLYNPGRLGRRGRPAGAQLSAGSD
jgi:hypothetical protein